ncbi:hypothetical protein PoB_002297200 [Plakobranchus ocellatus]|uniref:Ig-like domain-containing protein n=1 Tax=Plakobranchus ocellatus TaxID=259542 RepID=A0AAV3ZMP0_9GAST|nr:hypothetical protein PoB_002297200 [Plakobranchus ocellatus]
MSRRLIRSPLFSCIGLEGMWSSCGMHSIMATVTRMFYFATLFISASLACEIDFHTEAASLVLLEGKNGSILCDATSCDNDAPGGDLHQLSVVWRNQAGSEVANVSGRLLSVPYGSGLMNRLMVIDATIDLRGRYRCSVMRNGVILQEKSIPIYIMARFETARPTTRRIKARGDILPERKISFNYGPIRSDNARMNDGSGTDEAHLSTFETSEPDKYVVDNGNKLQPESKLISLFKMNDQVADNSDQAKKVADTDRSNPRESGNSFLSLMSIGLVRNSEDKAEIGSKIQQHSVLESSMPVTDEAVSVADVGERNSRSGEMSPAYARHKRQASLGSSTTENMTMDSPTTKGMMMESSTTKDMMMGSSTAKNMMMGSSESILKDEANYTTKPTTRHMESSDGDDGPRETRTLGIVLISENSTYDIATEPTVTTSVTTKPLPSTSSSSSSPTTKTTDKGKDGQPDATPEPKPGSSGCVTDSNGNHPDWPNKEESFFGRHGAAAFAITLGVAILLLYALIMILVMPKILARCRKSSKLNGGTEKAAMYRKKASGIEDEAPMTLLSESTQNHDVVLAQENRQSGPADNKSYEDDDGEEPSDAMQPAVSTFLLRRSSQMKADESKPARKDSVPDKSTKPAVKDSEEITLKPGEIKLEVEERPAADPSRPNPSADQSELAKE